MAMSSVGAPSAIAQALFKGADANKDNKITADEFKQIAGAVTGVTSPTAAQSAQAFKALDSDGSGDISLTELAQANFTGNRLSPEAQANLQAYASLNSALNNISSGTAAGLYASLNGVGAGNASGLTAQLLGGELTAKNLLA